MDDATYLRYLDAALYDFNTNFELGLCTNFSCNPIACLSIFAQNVNTVLKGIMNLDIPFHLTPT